MRICLVSKEYPPLGTGGVAGYVHLLANGLAAAGHDITVITGPGHPRGRRQPAAARNPSPQGAPCIDAGNAGPEGEDAPDSRDHHRLTLYPVRHGRLPLPSIVTRRASGLWDLLARSRAVAGAIARLERTQGNFDLVEMPNWGLEALFFSLRPRAPLAVRMSTPLELSHQFRIPAAGGRRATSQAAAHGSPGLRLHCYLEGVPVRRADCVIANSRHNAGYCAGLYRISAQAIHVIHHGVHVPRRAPGQREDGGKTVRVLFVGSLQRRKGIHLLLQAIPRVLEKMPHVRFAVAGLDAPDPLLPPRTGPGTAPGPTWQEHFEETASPAARRATTFHGHVDATALERLYRECDILAAPSLFESFGLMYAEAMAHAKPVVAFRAGAAPEVVVHNETGLLVEPLSIGGLAGALIRLAASRKQRRELGGNGYRRAALCFSAERMVEATLEAYRQTLAAKQ